MPAPTSDPEVLEVTLPGDWSPCYDLVQDVALERPETVDRLGAELVAG